MVLFVFVIVDQGYEMATIEALKDLGFEVNIIADGRYNLIGIKPLDHLFDEPHILEEMRDKLKHASFLTGKGFKVEKT